MRRFSSALVTLALVAQPLSAFAFYETPGAVLQAIQFDSGAKTVKAEVHGSHKTTYFSMWANGMAEGTTYPDMKANVQITIDVADTANFITGRVKAGIIMVDGRMFFKVDSVTGTFDEETILASFNFALKKWIEVPVDPSSVMEIQEVLLQSGTDLSMADELYTLERIPYQYGSSYVLTLKPGALEEIGLLPDMMGGDILEQTMEIKVDANYKDEVQVSQMTFDMNVEGVQIRGQTKTEKMKSGVTVNAPVDAVSIEWLMEHLDGIGGSSLIDPSDFLPGMDDGAEWEEDDWSESIDEEDMPVQGLRPTRPRVRLSQPVNRVDSGINKPSRRMIKAGNTNRS